MGRPCVVCNHPQRDEINERLEADIDSIRQIAKEYGLPKSTVANHKIRCTASGRDQLVVQEIKTIAASHPNMSKPALARAILPEREELVRQYGEIANRLDMIVKEAQAAGSRLYAIQGLNAMKGVLDSVARVTGYTVTTPKVQVNVGVSAASIAEELMARIKTIDAEVIEEITADE